MYCHSSFTTEIEFNKTADMHSIRFHINDRQENLCTRASRDLGAHIPEGRDRPP